MKMKMKMKMKVEDEDEDEDEDKDEDEDEDGDDKFEDAEKLPRVALMSICPPPFITSSSLTFTFSSVAFSLLSVVSSFSSLRRSDICLVSLLSSFFT